MGFSYEPKLKTGYVAEELAPGQFAIHQATGHLVFKVEPYSNDEKTHPQDTVVDLVTGQRSFSAHDLFDKLPDKVLTLTTNSSSKI